MWARARRRRMIGRTVVERIDLQHFLDRRNSGNWLLGELADAKRKRAREFAIEIHGASAHSGDHAGIFRLGTVQSNQDNVALGTVYVVHHAQDFDVHGFGLYTLKHGKGSALHANVNLIERDDRKLGGKIFRLILCVKPDGTNRNGTDE